MSGRSRSEEFQKVRGQCVMQEESQGEKHLKLTAISVEEGVSWWHDFTGALPIGLSDTELALDSAVFEPTDKT